MCGGKFPAGLPARPGNAAATRACRSCTCDETPLTESRCVACGMELTESKDGILADRMVALATEAAEHARAQQVIADRMAALAIEAAEVADRKERAAREAKGTEGVPGVHQCPRCACPLIVLPGEMNCTIFICAVAKCFKRDASTQLSQHDEGAAARAKADDALVSGCCGGQFRYDEKSAAMVACEGR
jgi:hypothetical protein